MGIRRQLVVTELQNTDPRSLGCQQINNITIFVMSLFRIVDDIKSILGSFKTCSSFQIITSSIFLMVQSSKAWRLACVYLLLRWTCFLLSHITLSYQFILPLSSNLKRVEITICPLNCSVSLGLGQYQYYDEEDQVSIKRDH